MKIIVAHEGKQHSFKTAEALYRNGILFKYITTVYDKPHSFTRLLKGMLKGDAKKKCASRRTAALPDSQVKQVNELAGLLLLLITKIPFNKRLIILYYDWLHDSFGKKVARYAITNKVDAVIMYDANANSCWKVLKKKAPYIKRIMDVSIANRFFIKECYVKDLELTKNNFLKEEQSHLWDLKNIKRYITEINDTDYFLVGSKFVQNSLLYSGINVQLIKIIPYGVDINKFKYVNKNRVDGALHLIFVGSVSYRKGIHHLLSVVSGYSKEEVVLNIAGGYSLNSDYYKTFKSYENINFLGFVTPDLLADEYNKADVFLLPSLAEGFAQVSLEAMSCGLPVICTTNSGCNDAVTDFENGFVIPVSDKIALKEKIDWFLNNRSELSRMSLNARTTSLNYSWDNYFEKIVCTVKKLS